MTILLPHRALRRNLTIITFTALMDSYGAGLGSGIGQRFQINSRMLTAYIAFEVSLRWRMHRNGQNRRRTLATRIRGQSRLFQRGLVCMLLVFSIRT